MHGSDENGDSQNQDPKTELELTGTDNRYMEIMNLCVLHLSDVERDTGSGVDREELIQWYLEQKEMDLESEEDLEYERELIAKALTKLSKVSPDLPRLIHIPIS